MSSRTMRFPARAVQHELEHPHGSSVAIVQMRAVRLVAEGTCDSQRRGVVLERVGIRLDRVELGEREVEYRGAHLLPDAASLCTLHEP